MGETLCVGTSVVWVTYRTSVKQGASSLQELALDGVELVDGGVLVVLDLVQQGVVR